MATFTVNGQSVNVEENQRLLRFLRDTLRLTSVKDGCSEGACGTCTVLVLSLIHILRREKTASRASGEVVRTPRFREVCGRPGIS